MSIRGMRVGFLSFKNYYDRLSFSGILFNMWRHLGKHMEVVPLGRPFQPSRLRNWLARWEERRCQAAIRQGNPDPRWTSIGRIIERQLQDTSIDFIFAPVASRELSVVAVDRPVIYASDTTSKLLIPAYGLRLSPEETADRGAAESRAIRIARGLVYSSTWAADSAVADYGAERDKIRIIPFGANVEEVPKPIETMKKLGAAPWRIVFLGLDWQRKGGDIAIAAFRELLRSHPTAELTIIGSQPPTSKTPPSTRVIPFLNKRTVRGRREFNDILLSSHFMLFPSRADCSPIALCEAAAFGLPVITSDVGGISSIVTPETGRLLPAGSEPIAYADAIAELMSDSAGYGRMVCAARQRYEESLNWDRWAQSLAEFSRHILAAKTACR